MINESTFLSFANCKLLVSCAAVILVATTFLASANAQSAAVDTIQSANTPAAVTSLPNEDTRYRIGPGDVLTIVVRKAPDLSLEAVRVDQRGLIRIPMIDDGVPAACKTESELAADIKKLYLEYKTNPSVEVFVKEFQSQPVAVIGAVDKPGQFRLQRQVRLLELISFAGGHTDKAGRVINVIHAGGANLCAKDAAGNGAKAEGQIADASIGGPRPWRRCSGGSRGTRPASSKSATPSGCGAMRSTWPSASTLRARRGSAHTAT